MSVDIDAFLDPSTVDARAAAVREQAAESSPGDGYVLDVMEYLDPEQYRDELRVFGRSWHIAATSAELARPGQFVRWDFTGRPIVVTRADDGALHAFYAVCLHRGGPVASEACGEARLFTCPYHNWSYDLTGRFAGMPSAEHFPDLATQDLRLPSVAVAELGGLVWINEDRDAEDLATWLGSVGESIRRGALEEFDLESHQRYVVDANWKISTEGGIDTYHIDYLHQTTARGILDNGGTLVATDGPHSTAIVPLRRPELAATYRPGQPEDAIAGNIQCWAFPTHTVSLFPYAVAVISHYPSAIDQTVVDWRVLVHRDVAEPELRAQIVENYEAVFAEDRALCPQIQDNLETRVLGHLHLGVKEDRVHHLHEAMIDAIQKLPPE